MLLIKIKTFLKSLLFHVYRGFPKSTSDQIQTRYMICKSCLEFDSKKSECSICGCTINTKKVFLNKLAWADQECPLGKWQKIPGK
jgi:uncharacterized paraquat-inducible protein A